MTDRSGDLQIFDEPITLSPSLVSEVATLPEAVLVSVCGVALVILTLYGSNPLVGVIGWYIRLLVDGGQRSRLGQALWKR